VKHRLDRRGATLCGASPTDSPGDDQPCPACRDIAEDYPYLTLTEEEARAFAEGLARSGGSRA